MDTASLILLNLANVLNMEDTGLWSSKKSLEYRGRFLLQSEYKLWHRWRFVLLGLIFNVV